MIQLKFSEDPEISDLIRKVAAGEASRGRAMGWWRSDWYFDWQDVAQEIACEVPALIAAFNPEFGVPLMAYLRQRLTWKARGIIAPERDWQRGLDEFEENEIVEAGKGYGTRTVGSRKITLRDFGPSEVETGLFGNLSRATPASRATLDHLQDAMLALPPDDFVMVRMSRDSTQSQIASQLSESGTTISQSQVSRRNKATIKKLSAIVHKTDSPEIYT